MVFVRYAKGAGDDWRIHIVNAAELCALNSLTKGLRTGSSGLLQAHPRILDHLPPAWYFRRDELL